MYTYFRIVYLDLGISVMCIIYKLSLILTVIIIFSHLINRWSVYQLSRKFELNVRSEIRKNATPNKKPNRSIMYYIIILLYVTCITVRFALILGLFILT